MKNVVFKWLDTNGPNHVVCTSYDEVVEFCEQNKNDTFTVDVWEE